MMVPFPESSQWCSLRGVGRPSSPRTNGAMNNLLPADAPAHGWYRFVLSFPPHLVRRYAERFELGESSVLLDPFCGTGTTVVEGKKLGIPSRGIEALPVAFHAAATKVDWSPDPDRLVAHAELIADKALARLDADGHTDDPIEGAPEEAGLRTLAPEAFKLLLHNSISPLPLHKTLTLIDALDGEHHPEYAGHERLALAKILPSQVGNLRFGPEVGVGALKDDAPVVGPWLEQMRVVADDIRLLEPLDRTPAIVRNGDARAVENHIEPAAVDAVICSPPYPNEKDYTRTVRLESVLLGLMHNRPGLRATKQRLLRSNTRGVYKTDDDDTWLVPGCEVNEIADSIEERRIALGKTSGFERMYHRVTRLYFGGMARHFESLSRILKPGARLAYVVGDQASYLRVMIRTGELLADVARTVGYEVEGIDLFRTRLATATGEQLREEVLLLRWPA